MWIFLIGLVITIVVSITISVIIISILEKSKKQQCRATAQDPPPPIPTLQDYLDSKQNKKISEYNEFTNCYQKRYLLTKNEWAQYKKLRSITEPMELIICPKVRLLDLIEPTRQSNKLLWKIQAKHVDFVICNKDLHVRAILELDDNSHDQPDRQERDRFVDFVLSNVGYTVIRTRYVNENTLDILKPQTTEANTTEQLETASEG